MQKSLYFNIYEQDKFHAQFSMKIFYNHEH